MIYQHYFNDLGQRESSRKKVVLTPGDFHIFIVTNKPSYFDYGKTSAQSLEDFVARYWPECELHYQSPACYNYRYKNEPKKLIMYIYKVKETE